MMCLLLLLLERAHCVHLNADWASTLVMRLSTGVEGELDAYCSSYELQVGGWGCADYCMLDRLKSGCACPSVCCKWAEGACDH